MVIIKLLMINLLHDTLYVFISVDEGFAPPERFEPHSYGGLSKSSSSLSKSLPKSLFGVQFG